MTDPDINYILEKKEKDGIKITYHNSQKEKKLRKKVSGLYHKKLLIIDEKELYIGSANCSKSSLSLHGNQIFGFYNEELIESILQNNSFSMPNFELYLLPKDGILGFKRVIDILKKARGSISISMYALTHKLIIKEIINANKRGVPILLYLDQKMATGTCKKYVKLLEDANIPIFVRAKSGINHHKCALIDDTYIFGSINWSAAGFSKNEETLIILTDINNTLSKEVDSFFANLDYYSIPLTKLSMQ